MLIKIQLGTDTLNLDTTGLTDEEVLKAAMVEHPRGFIVSGSNAGLVWVNPKLILSLSNPDGFGIELVGFAHVAAELVRLATDPVKSELLGQQGCDRMITLFVQHAKTMGDGSSANKLHAVRFGMGAKAVGADRVELGTLEINPEGNVFKKLLATFDGHSEMTQQEAQDFLKGQSVLMVRHPFLLAGIFTVGYNVHMTRNTVLLNREEARRITAMDFDGDSINLFPLKMDSEAIAQLRAEIETAVELFDPNLLVLGVASHETEAGSWGENIFEDGKTTEAKLGMTHTKSIGEWLSSHIKMGECANTFTPFAYRILDICALMAGVGAQGGREAALIGGVLEESFYLSLSGGPDVMDKALEGWMRNKLETEAQQDAFFAGLTAEGEGVHFELLQRSDVRQVLLDGAKLNKEEFDIFDPAAAVAYLGWLAGKGTVTAAENITDKLKALVCIAHQPAGWELSKTFLGQLAFHAADKLTPILTTKLEESYI